MTIGQTYSLKIGRFLILIIFIAFSEQLKSQQFSVEGLKYKILNENLVEIIGSDSLMTNIDIPDTVSFENGKYCVYSIGENAFFKGNVKSVKCPNCLVNISDFAFSGASLESIELSANLRRIGSYAFISTNLKRIVLPDSLFYIGKYAFANTEISTIKIPSLVIKIEEGTFRRCKNLMSDSVNLSNINTLEAFAFSESGIVDLRFLTPKVKRIGSGCFMECCNLKKLELGTEVVSIQDSISYGLFQNCIALEEANIKSSNINGNKLFSGCYSLHSVILPDSMNNMNMTFQECEELISVDLPLYVNNMDYTFKFCRNLKRIRFPLKIESVDNCIEGCEKLQRIECTKDIFYQLRDSFPKDKQRKFKIIKLHSNCKKYKKTEFLSHSTLK